MEEAVIKSGVKPMAGINERKRWQNAGRKQKMRQRNDSILQFRMQRGWHSRMFGKLSSLVFALLLLRSVCRCMNPTRRAYTSLEILRNQYSEFLDSRTSRVFSHGSTVLSDYSFMTTLPAATYCSLSQLTISKLG